MLKGLKQPTVFRIAAHWLLQQSHTVIAVAVTIIGLVLFAYSGIGGNQRAGFLFLQDIEQRTLDTRFVLRGKRAPDPRIVIVGMDEKTLQRIGSFPLPRGNYALLVRQLKKRGARVIAFDENFPTAASSEALERPNTPAQRNRKLCPGEAEKRRSATGTTIRSRRAVCGRA